MRVTESLLRQNNLKRNQKNQKNEEDEPTQTYRKKEQHDWTLNQHKTVFASPMNEGLNTKGSIFDQRAVFRTKEGEE